MVKTAWWKTQGIKGIDQNTDSFFGTIWPSKNSQKMSENDHFCPTHYFLHFPWDLSTFSAEGPIPNAHFARGPWSKGSNYALEKILTNETPGKNVTLCGMNVVLSHVSSCSHPSPPSSSSSFLSSAHQLVRLFLFEIHVHSCWTLNLDHWDWRSFASFVG